MKSEPLENYKGIVVLINILNGGIDAQRRIEEYRTEMIAKEEIE
jgi:translation elongation factor EF-4